METKKVKKVTGYSAFDKATGKALVDRSSYWTNKLNLSNNITESAIGTKETIDMKCKWYNRSHKNQVDFEIKKISRIYTTEIIVEEDV